MYKRILLPVDLNEVSSWQKALPTALTLCRTFDATLHIVTVLPELKRRVGGYFPRDFAMQARNAARKAQREFIDNNIPEGFNAQGVLVEGSPWKVITKVSRRLNSDLIVMASHSKRRFSDYVLGPNAEHVVHHSKISVMVVR